MATYVPPKRGVEFIFYVSLTSQADIKLFQANPTLATGDVKVSTDGAAFGNLTTLPTVTPASGRGVKVTVSAAEMTGDNVLVVFSDASGAEWSDLAISIQTTARQVDDLTFPTTSGRSLDVTATGGAGIDWSNVENPTTALDLSGTSTKALEPTTAGRKLDVTTTGGAGVDWSNVEAPTTVLALTNTTISPAQVVGSLGSGAITNVQTGAAAAITAAEPIDANIVSINDTDVIGDGDGTPWGPA